MFANVGALRKELDSFSIGLAYRIRMHTPQHVASIEGGCLEIFDVPQKSLLTSQLGSIYDLILAMGGSQSQDDSSGQGQGSQGYSQGSRGTGEIVKLNVYSPSGGQHVAP